MFFPQPDGSLYLKVTPRPAVDSWMKWTIIILNKPFPLGVGSWRLFCTTPRFRHSWFLIKNSWPLVAGFILSTRFYLTATEISRGRHAALWKSNVEDALSSIQPILELVGLQKCFRLIPTYWKYLISAVTIQLAVKAFGHASRVDLGLQDSCEAGELSYPRVRFSLVMTFLIAMRPVWAAEPIPMHWL